MVCRERGSSEPSPTLRQGEANRRSDRPREEPVQRRGGDDRDDGDERVRYAMVGTRPSSRTGSDFTAIVFAVNDSPGALHEILRQFAERGVNLTKIQSRPTLGENWQYVFFIEVEGHATDRQVIGAIEDVRRLSKFFKVLGSYQLG